MNGLFRYIAKHCRHSSFFSTAQIFLSVAVSDWPARRLSRFKHVRLEPKCLILLCECTDVSSTEGVALPPIKRPYESRCSHTRENNPDQPGVVHSCCHSLLKKPRWWQSGTKFLITECSDFLCERVQASSRSGVGVGSFSDYLNYDFYICL